MHINMLCCSPRTSFVRSASSHDTSLAHPHPLPPPPPPPPPDQDLTIFVQQLLEQMQGRFSTMSDQIIGRIDEMGGRIDDLEKSIGDLMETAGVDAPEAGPPPDGPPPS